MQNEIRAGAQLGKNLARIGLRTAREHRPIKTTEFVGATDQWGLFFSFSFRILMFP